MGDYAFETIREILNLSSRLRRVLGPDFDSNDIATFVVRARAGAQVDDLVVMAAERDWANASRSKVRSAADMVSGASDQVVAYFQEAAPPQDRYVVITVNLLTGVPSNPGVIHIGDQGRDDAERIARNWRVRGKCEAFVIGLS